MSESNDHRPSRAEPGPDLHDHDARQPVKGPAAEGGEEADHLVVPDDRGPLAVRDEPLSGQQSDRVVEAGHGRHLCVEHREAVAMAEIGAVALDAALSVAGPEGGTKGNEP